MASKSRRSLLPRHTKAPPSPSPSICVCTCMCVRIRVHVYACVCVCMCVRPSINEKIYYWFTNVVSRRTRPFSAQLCLAQALRIVGARPGTAALKFIVSSQRDADLCGRKQRRPKLSWGKVRNSWVGEVPKAGKDNKLVLSRLVVLFCLSWMRLRAGAGQRLRSFLQRLASSLGFPGPSQWRACML